MTMPNYEIGKKCCHKKMSLGLQNHVCPPSGTMVPRKTDKEFVSATVAKNHSAAQAWSNFSTLV